MRRSGRPRRFIPRITLTGLLELASTSLAGLFSGGAFQWSPGSDVTYTIFQGGAGRANVRLTEAQRDAAVAEYQRTIQQAFREVADALARRGTIGEQLRARQSQREAAADTYLLTEARYRNDKSFLGGLDAQRSYYSAQRTLVLSRLGPRPISSIFIARSAATHCLGRPISRNQAPAVPRSHGAGSPARAGRRPGRSNDREPAAEAIPDRRW